MASINDLMRVEGRAELVSGEIIRFRRWFRDEGRVLSRLFRSLSAHQEWAGGEAFTSTVAYIVAPLPSGRESVSPAASWYDGPFPANEMGPILGPPTFAVEFAEQMTPTRLADYFQAGTRVVWEVALTERLIRKYSPDETTFPRGTLADAEPAVPGWRMNVDSLFA